MHGYTDLLSLAWVEEFGGEQPGVGACMCEDCVGQRNADLGPSLASVVSGTFALVR